MRWRRSKVPGMQKTHPQGDGTWEICKAHHRRHGSPYVMNSILMCCQSSEKDVGGKNEEKVRTDGSECG